MRKTHLPWSHFVVHLKSRKTYMICSPSSKCFPVTIPKFRLLHVSIIIILQGIFSLCFMCLINDLLIFLNFETSPIWLKALKIPVTSIVVMIWWPGHKFVTREHATEKKKKNKKFNFIQFYCIRVFNFDASKISSIHDITRLPK
jgi:hypothetical protein